MPKIKCRFAGRVSFHDADYYGAEYYKWWCRDASGREYAYVILVTDFWKVGTDARK